MYKWSWISVLLISGNMAWANDCIMPPPVLEQSPRSIESQRLVLPGTAKLQFALGNTATTFAHLGDMLIVKYDDGAILSHRVLESSELRADASTRLPFTDFIRLVFGIPVEGADDKDAAEAKAHQETIQIGCTAIGHYQFGGIDVYGYAQTRFSGERYHALFLLDGDKVSFVDITGSDTLMENVISTMSQRN